MPVNTELLVVKNTLSWTTAVVGFKMGMVVLFGVAYMAFKNQNESNYGE